MIVAMNFDVVLLHVLVYSETKKRQEIGIKRIFFLICGERKFSWLIWVGQKSTFEGNEE